MDTLLFIERSLSQWLKTPPVPVITASRTPEIGPKIRWMKLPAAEQIRRVNGHFGGAKK